MLPIFKKSLNELKTLFNKSWEWRVGYLLIGGFIAARWLGLFSSLELVTLDFFLSHRPAENKDDHVTIVLIDETNFRGDQSLSDTYFSRLLEAIFATNPTVVSLNTFREDSVHEEGREQLIDLFRKHNNLIGVEKILPPQTVPPIAGVPEDISEEQFGFNDLSIDRDSRIRRAFVGAYLTDQTPADSTDNPFVFSSSFMLARRYLENKGYTLENLPKDRKTPGFTKDNKKYVKVPRLKPTFGGYIRDDNVADIQTLLNFRSGTETFNIIYAKNILSDDFDVNKIRDKAVIVGVTDPIFPQFLPVSASSNLLRETHENREVLPSILPKLGAVGTEIEAHAASQIINAVLHGRPLISTIYPAMADILLVFVGTAGILIGNTFESIFRNTVLLIFASGALLGGSYFLLWQFGIWLPVFSASSLLAITGVTYIAFYQSERLAIIESRKLEEERRKAIEKTFNAIHAGPLQTLASLLRNVRDGNTDQAYLLEDLKSLNQEIRGIGERLRQEAIGDVYFVDIRRHIRLDLRHPMHEVFYEIYNLCLQKELPGFETIKIRSVAFEPFECRLINLETKRSLCWFLQESLDNVGKHATGTTRLFVTGKIDGNLYTLRIEDNGPGLQSSHIGEGTRLFYQLEELLRGKFSRQSKKAGGTICQFSWPL